MKNFTLILFALLFSVVSYSQVWIESRVVNVDSVVNSTTYGDFVIEKHSEYPDVVFHLGTIDPMLALIHINYLSTSNIDTINNAEHPFSTLVAFATLGSDTIAVNAITAPLNSTFSVDLLMLNPADLCAQVNIIDDVGLISQGGGYLFHAGTTFYDRSDDILVGDFSEISPVELQFDELCPGFYRSGQINFFCIGDPHLVFSTNTSIEADVDVIDETGFGNCDGSVVVNNITDGVMPYTYDWINVENSVSQASLTDLCSGYYQVLIADANGDQLLKPFIIASPEVTDDFTNFGFIPEDTLNLLHENCEIDYSQPIDSVSFIGMEVVSLDSNVIVLNWSMYQNGFGYDYLDTINFNGLDDLLIFVGVYCDDVQKSISQVRKLIFNMSKTDINESLAVDEHNLYIDVNIYPNPSSGMLNIKSDVKLDKIELMNSNGQVIRKLSVENDISDLSNGIYFVRFEANSIVRVKKFVKK